MGNSESSSGIQISGLKNAHESNNNPVYALVNLKSGGDLIDCMKLGINIADFTQLESMLESDKVSKFLYNNGRGKLVPTSDVVKIRNKERNAMLGALKRKKGKGRVGPNILEQVDQNQMQGDMMKALKMLDGGGKGGKGGSKYRELCWDIDQRGAMGETVVHVCLLQGTTLHNELAKRLIQMYPKLINDIFISEDYYGNSCLHQAIVNEDPEMVRFLLMWGANVHQRCYGAFFCPDDQKGSRTDSLEHEWVDVNPKTNYASRTYWGEYPLSFAACTQQIDCFRLLRAKKADPNMKDTNGNTVLHMMVIHELKDMFDLAMQMGARLHVKNNQQLIPLNLAAYLAKKEMFNHVLTKERDILWTYGDVVCAAYPLENIDTIEESTGELNLISALGLTIYGVPFFFWHFQGETTPAHLDLLDGLMEDLLTQKWNSFAKTRLIQNFIGFTVYFFFFFNSFIFRRHSIKYRFDNHTTTSEEAASLWNDTLIGTNEANATPSFDSIGDAEILRNLWCNSSARLQRIYNELNSNNNNNNNEGAAGGGIDENFGQNNHNNTTNGYQPAHLANSWGNFYDSFYYCNDRCHLMRVHDWHDFVRLTSECFTLIGVFVYIASAVLQGRRIGWTEYIKTLKAFPAKFIFHISFVFVLGMVPLRLACWLDAEHIFCVFAMLSTSVHFLFFCRGIRFVGPFVLMLYKIIAGDLVRFIMIYLIFVCGFSQSFFVVFSTCRRADYADYNSMTDGQFSRPTNCTMDVGNVTVVNTTCQALQTLLTTTTDVHYNTAEDLELIAAGKAKYKNILEKTYLEPFTRMFIMSLGEFSILYRELQGCRLAWLGKILFVIFELLVSILMINLLIAMMARTYQEIMETQKEWKRQWSKVILMIERALSPQDRLIAQLKYSRPIGSSKSKRAFVVKYKRTVTEKQDDLLEKIKTEKTDHPNRSEGQYDSAHPEEEELEVKRKNDQAIKEFKEMQKNKMKQKEGVFSGTKSRAYTRLGKTPYPGML